MTRLWEDGEGLDAAVLAYTAGEDHALDNRLLPCDLQTSRAHAATLAACGYLGEAERAALDAALEEIGAAHARGEWRVSLDEEDCHTAIENRLVAREGEAYRLVMEGGLPFREAYRRVAGGGVGALPAGGRSQGGGNGLPSFPGAPDPA